LSYIIIKEALKVGDFFMKAFFRAGLARRATLRAMYVRTSCARFKSINFISQK
jgi:hypothetical protein